MSGREAWDAICKAEIARMMRLGLPAEKAIRMANASVTAVYGPRPEKEKDPASDKAGAPWWLKFGVGLFLGGKMDKVKTFVNRYLVLFAVVYSAINFGLDILVQAGSSWAPYVKTVTVTIFGLLSVTPDPAVSTAVVGVGTAAIALYGAVRKVVSMIAASKK